jgi:DNA-directed RNA polymerase subunit beta
VPAHTEGKISRTKRSGDNISVIITRRSSVHIGDKLAGRHGNKGVVARILPQEDMPFMDDGTPVQMVLNPLGVISRLNIGQILETHYGFVAEKLGVRIQIPPYCVYDQSELQRLLRAAGIPETGMVDLYDGTTGRRFDSPVTVGRLYMMKLTHLVDDKMHARSTGPYSLVTGQPVGGKAQSGGQIFGAMQMLALQAYGARHTLQEFLTVKSDDAVGRAGINACLLYGECEPELARHPHSLTALEDVLRGLALNVDGNDER